MWPFATRPVVDADTAQWHVDNFTWLTEQFAGGDAFAKTRLVLPKPGFFTSEGEQGHALALRIFTHVKIYCGMEGWEVDLIEDDNPLARAAPFSADMVAPVRHALGTFGVSGERIQISYVPALLAQPHRLIATFAHELGHYLLAVGDGKPPCLPDEMECLTDLAAVFMGFGVFLANARFQVETAQDGPMQGWRIGHSGYLPEADLIFALALFLRAKNLTADAAGRCLKPHLAGMLRRALRALPDDHPHVVRIRGTLAQAASADDEPKSAAE